MPRQRKPRPEAPPPPGPDRPAQSEPPPQPPGQHAAAWYVGGRRVFPPQCLDDLEELANHDHDGRIFDSIPEWPRLVEHYRRLYGIRPVSVYDVVDGLATVLAASQHCARAAVKFRPLADVLRLLERQAKRVRDPELEARDEWIYRQCCDTSQPLKDILTRLGDQCQRQGWSMIYSVQGIRRAAANYADRHGLDRPPRRQDL